MHRGPMVGCDVANRNQANKYYTRLIGSTRVTSDYIKPIMLFAGFY